ncbi:hypothetical protein T4C_12718 [Trichinella pseudospiralis]|uniref:FLYWCH-type domain-containing protein n=1 Tax=Trichinella pseudospiralis TaxID=6337 RepID=A0A0V1J3Q0_TRIPS|nr:hypothetical protein T4C_12718 [Trichinella pseudospiralis]
MTNRERGIEFPKPYKTSRVVIVPRRSFPSLMQIFMMADIAELRLVTNRRGGTSLVYEGRSYKLRYRQTGEKWGYSKKGCKDGLSTNLDVTAVLRQTSHSKNCPVDEDIAYQMENRAMLKKRSAEEAKTMPQIYDEEAAAANAEPPTSGQVHHKAHPGLLDRQ